MTTFPRWRYVIPVMIGVGSVATSAVGAGHPSVSLNACQNTVRSAGKTYIQQSVAALDNCLQHVSTNIVQKNATGAAAAAPVCVTEFRKLSDSRHLGKSLPEKLQAAIAKQCVPGGKNTHTLGDILGTGASVPQPLAARRLGHWCAQFGGGGSIDTLREWIDCEAAALTCEARQAVSAQYPRALEWLALVRPAMRGLTPPASDPQQIADALAGLDAAKAAIDGPDGDNVPSIQCGTSCGDNVKNGNDQCDGTDVGGASCTSLDFAGGTLGCTSACKLDFSGCTGPPSRLPGTGQYSCWNSSGTFVSCTGTGQDGDTHTGADLAYIDNGDGTITDVNTKLMWEKLSRDRSIHDSETRYTWTDAIGVKIATLNNTSFAGYNDWRLPNYKELLSLVDLQFANPAIHPIFKSCFVNCNVLDCSCTAFNGDYWTSSIYASPSGFVWEVEFVAYYQQTAGGPWDGSGNAGINERDTPLHVRAVRGGF